MTELFALSPEVYQIEDILLSKICQRQCEIFIINPAIILSARKNLFISQQVMQPHAQFSVEGMRILKETSVLEECFYDHQMGRSLHFNICVHLIPPLSMGFKMPPDQCDAYGRCHRVTNAM